MLRRMSILLVAILSLSRVTAHAQVCPDYAHGDAPGVFQGMATAWGYQQVIKDHSNLSAAAWRGVSPAWNLQMIAHVSFGILESAHVRAYAWRPFITRTAVNTTVPCEVRGTVHWKGLVSNFQGLNGSGAVRVWVALVERGTGVALETAEIHSQACGDFISQWCGSIDRGSRQFHIITTIHTNRCYEIRLYADCSASAAFGANIGADFWHCWGLCADTGGVWATDVGLHLGTPALVPVASTTWGKVKSVYK